MLANCEPSYIEEQLWRAKPVQSSRGERRRSPSPRRTLQRGLRQIQAVVQEAAVTCDRRARGSAPHAVDAELQGQAGYQAPTAEHKLNGWPTLYSWTSPA